MDHSTLSAHVERSWRADIMPLLQEYVAIPCESPAFDPHWARSGHIDRAADLLADWARAQLADVPGASIEIVRLAGRTPLIFVDIPGDAEAGVVIYGHFDKQPAMTGWSAGRSAWTPVMEEDRLYGRGAADDGYALPAAIVAIRALRAQGLVHPACRILVEGSEESGSGDLPAYIEHLAPRLGAPAMIVALDASCGNYEQLWLTTSLRGQVAGRLTVRTLSGGVHSGDASGVAPSSFRIARELLSRLEDPASGAIVAGFDVDIPPERRMQAAQAGRALGAGIAAGLPFAAGVQPVSADSAELVLNRTWRPQLTVTGIDGLPAVAEAAAVMHPATTLKLSLRLPPTLDPDAAAQRLKRLLESQPPHAARVSFEVDFTSAGWHASPIAPWLASALDAASQQAFDAPVGLLGGGGGIPFVDMLARRFPESQLVVTGVLGPNSNAHGPDEFLHLPAARRLTLALARLLHEAHPQLRA